MTPTPAECYLQLTKLTMTPTPADGACQTALLADYYSDSS